MECVAINLVPDSGRFMCAQCDISQRANDAISGLWFPQRPTRH
jgi:hypothetical protein